MVRKLVFISDYYDPYYDRWYHGKLDRTMAEERLQQARNPGSYLIRESDRRPGSFVLSFLSMTNVVNHFRYSCTWTLCIHIPHTHTHTHPLAHIHMEAMPHIKCYAELVSNNHLIHKYIVYFATSSCYFVAKVEQHWKT